MFLNDLIIPENINKFIINKDKISKIQSLFSANFMSNLYIYGPSGCGKYTLFIKNLELILKTPIVVKNKTITLTNQWSSIKEIIVPCSSFHFEIIISKYSNNKSNLYSIIDTLTDTKEINVLVPYKIILIRNIHLASQDIIKFIKQKAEQHEEFVRIILIGNTNSNNLKILNGTFFPFRLSSPSKKDIISSISNIPSKYLKKSLLKKINLDNIIDESNFNINYILVKVQMLLINNFYNTEIEDTSNKIIKFLIDKKLTNLLELRELIYGFVTNNLDVLELFKHLLLNLNNKEFLCISKKIKILNVISDFDYNFKLSYKELIHIEAALFKIFSIIHND